MDRKCSLCKLCRKVSFPLKPLIIFIIQLSQVKIERRETEYERYKEF